MKDKLKKAAVWVYGKDSDEIGMRMWAGFLAVLICGFAAFAMADPLAALWVVAGLVGAGLLLPILGRAAEWLISKYF